MNKAKNKKFTKKDCNDFLSKLKLPKFSRDLITEGIKWCIENKKTHLDVTMTVIYRMLSDKHCMRPRVIEGEIYTDVKKIDDFDKAEILNFEGNLTNKKLFMLILERYER